MIERSQNMLIKSQTGTIAYLLPILHDLISLRPQIRRSDGCRALVIEPTRELCTQIGEVLHKLTQCCVWVDAPLAESDARVRRVGYARACLCWVAGCWTIWAARRLSTWQACGGWCWTRWTDCKQWITSLFCYYSQSSSHTLFFRLWTNDYANSHSDSRWEDSGLEGQAWRHSIVLWTCTARGSCRSQRERRSATRVTLLERPWSDWWRSSRWSHLCSHGTCSCKALLPERAQQRYRMTELSSGEIKTTICEMNWCPSWFEQAKKASFQRIRWYSLWSLHYQRCSNLITNLYIVLSKYSTGTEVRMNFFLRNGLSLKNESWLFFVRKKFFK